MTRRVCLTLICVLAVTWWIAADSGAVEEAATLQTQIEKLMQERRDTLRQRAEVVKDLYRGGTTSFERVIAAENELLVA